MQEIGGFKIFLFLKGPPHTCRGGGCTELPSTGPGPKSSAGFSGYARETQRTFKSSFCTEPEIADSWGNPSLILSFLFNRYRAASAKPLGNQLITDIRAGEKAVH